MLVALRFFQGALASCFSSPPPPAPTPAGVGGLNRTVKHCAVGKARRFTQRGIDPGFVNLESGNPLLDAGRSAGSPKQLVRLGAYLIRRRLCGSSFSEMPIFSDGLLSDPAPSPLPHAPGGRGALRSSGVRGRPSAPKRTSRPGRVPLPLKGGGWDWHSSAGEGVGTPGIPKLSPAPSSFSFNWRPHHG